MATHNPANPLEVELALDSIAGRPILNAQNWYTYSRHEIIPFEEMYRTQFPRITERTEGCTKVYNCHGLVFASRRTQIYDPAVVKQILSEDRYQEISFDHLLPGDIILYLHSSGDIPHSGIVVEPTLLMPKNPRVVSKWGPWVEVVHYAYDCPYAKEPDIKIEYRRVTL